MERLEYIVEAEYITIGPVSAASSTDGTKVFIDFVRMDDLSKAIRLGVPAERIEDFVTALRIVQKALADTASGIHIQELH